MYNTLGDERYKCSTFYQGVLLLISIDAQQLRKVSSVGWCQLCDGHHTLQVAIAKTSCLLLQE